MVRFWIYIGMAIAVLVLAVVVAADRSVLLSLLPEAVHDWAAGRWHGYRVQRDVFIAMPDGVRLATDIYFPRDREANDRRAAILIRSPYDKRKESWSAGRFAARGYIALVQDMRGRHLSEGRYAPIRADRQDGYATLDWIVRQPWSNGRVGTYGCSALGETQIALAATRHPAHAALVALADGGAIGVMPDRLAAFGWYEGGIFNLASGFGWFLHNGWLDPEVSAPDGVDVDKDVWGLPVVDLMKQYHPDENSFERYISTPPSDPAWLQDDFVTPSDRFDAPVLQVTTWQDQAVDDTLEISRLIRRSAGQPGAGDHNHVIVAPGNHCDFDAASATGKVGDLAVGPEARLPLADLFLQWFGHWLNGAESSPDLPRYLLYVTGEDRWVQADEWPLPAATEQRWYLHSGGHANSRRGDGGLSLDLPDEDGADQFTYDPANPVPTRGGPFCCTSNPVLRPGPVDQREVEERDDVLVYSSEPLREGVRVLGPIVVELTVSSDAPDTDFVAKLVDVDPAGLAINVQEGALRMRFRDGWQNPRLMEPGHSYTVRIPMRALGHYFRPGHRIRLQVTSSNFPRLERNLNTGGRNFDESVGRVAVNRVQHGSGVGSALILPVVDQPQYFQPSGL